MPTIMILQPQVDEMAGGGRTNKVNVGTTHHKPASPKASASTPPRRFVPSVEYLTPTQNFQSWIEEEKLLCPPPPKATRVPMKIKNRTVIFDKEPDFVDLSNGIVVVGTVSPKDVPLLSKEWDGHQRGGRHVMTSVARTKAEKHKSAEQPGKSQKLKKEVRVKQEEVKVSTDAVGISVKMEEEGITNQKLKVKEEMKTNRKTLKLNKLLNEAAEAAEKVSESNRRQNRSCAVAPTKRKTEEVTEDGTTKKRKEVASCSKSKTKTSSAPTPSIRMVKKQALRLAASTTKDLKPIFQLNEKVFAPWWPDGQRKSTPSWYSGVITNCVTGEGSGKYGPVRYYDIKFDDDKSESKGIVDACVWSQEDYLLSMSSDEGCNGKKIWVGVKNVLDKKSSDLWAKTVGWYNVSIDGKKYSFSRLVNALRAHDAHAIGNNVDDTKPSELNLSEEMIRQITSSK